MDEKLKKDIFLADYSNLVSYSTSLRNVISDAADKYIKLITASTVILISLIKFKGEAEFTGFESLFKEYSLVISVLYGGLTLIGLLVCLNVGRSRGHYIKIINYLNLIRGDCINVLNIPDVEYKIWTGKNIKKWPLNSSATYSLCLIVLINAFTFNIFVFSFAGKLNISIMCSVIYAVLLLATSKRISDESNEKVI